jgi:alkylhydroperoxidase family enzyme
MITRAMTTLSLDPRLRELAFVAVSRLNGSALKLDLEHP